LKAASPLLIIRFSSLGDVAMTVPVLRVLLAQHPSLHVRMVSHIRHAPLFENMERLQFFGADLSGRHRGLRGIFRLFGELRELGPYCGVADLHHVLRSLLLSGLFTFMGVPVARLRKGRKQKRELTRFSDKKLVPLPSGFERMVKVFEALGFSVSLPNGVDTGVRAHLSNLSGPTVIGIAPFAKHREKTYPPELMKAVLALLSSRADLQIRLFGADGTEADILRGWEQEFPGIISMAGRYSLRQQLDQLREVDLMISMDSANMHLASLQGVPVLSIWGSTHPYAGFMGWGQPMNSSIQVNLACRPCSVFGNRTCFRGDFACMYQIEPSRIVLELDRKLTALRQ